MFTGKDAVGIMRRELAPWIRAQGFRTSKGRSLAFARERSDGLFDVLGIGVTRHGVDPYAGGELLVELGISRSVDVAYGIRRRLSLVLGDGDEVRELVALNNRMIRELSPPDQGFVSSLPEDVRPWYLSRFQEEEVSSEARSLAAEWLRFATDEHVRRWAEYLRRVLPKAFERVAAARLESPNLVFSKST